MRLYEAVELIAPKRPAQLWLLIQKYMDNEIMQIAESELSKNRAVLQSLKDHNEGKKTIPTDSLDDFFEDQPAAVRLHNVDNEECESCSA